tara:strand:+ start:104 stop:784 length:681 start_codon:yes stop_codon:yes gene_type:complete
MKNKNYGILNLRTIDNIIEKKRFEMLNILKKCINTSQINSFLDIGTTEDDSLKSSNFFVKQFDYISTKKSISDQNITNEKFTKVLKKSITSNFEENEIDLFRSDLVISSATIEHVGNFENQKKMMENIMKLSDRYFLITTPNRFFPIDFHTKLPFLHMLPKKIHRYILIKIGLNEYAKEENLNLLDLNTLEHLIKTQNTENFKIKIFKIKLFGLTSNLLIFGEKKQ